MLQTQNLFVYLLSYFIPKPRFISAQNEGALLQKTGVTRVHHLAVTVLFHWSVLVHIL
jgi:hypothetical protein